ncbi:MAG TPA: outer membrane beta-barrel protein [Dongiaceae bacterium]|nr:outer membrane beta-barrel protein [Dongiaceae bacterium]
MLTATVAQGLAQDAAMVVPVPEFITGESVMQRFDRLHRPEGFQLGSFQLNARLDLSLGYGTNIYDSHDHAQDDGYAVTGLGFSAVSAQPDEALDVDGLINRTTYFSQSSNNEWSGRILAGGWKDVGDNLRVNGNAMVAREVERRDDPQSSPQTEPVLYWHYKAGAGVETQNAIITLSGGVAFDRVDYDNVNSTSGDISLSERNMNEIDATTRASYNIDTDRIIYLETVGNVRLPDDRYDSNGLRRQSAGVVSSLGANYAVSPALRFVTELGYRHQAYVDSQVANIDGPRAIAQAVWTPLLTTEITAQFAHDYYESFDGATPGYWLDSAALTLTQELNRDLVLVAQGSTGYRNFVDSSRYEHVYTFQAGMRWNVTTGLVVGLDNTFEYQTARATQGKFDSNVTLLHVTKTF